MNNRYIINDNGITIKKLFRSRLIAYEEIQSIVEDGEHNYISTKDGETIDISRGLSSITWKYPILLKYIEQYNIEFRAEDDLRNGAPLYTYEEVLQVAERTEEWIKEYANCLIVSKLGADHSIETEFYGLSDQESGINLLLLKDGNKVTLPEKLRNGCYTTDPSAIDYVELFFGPVLWDTEHRCGKYGVTVECLDEEQCRKTTLDLVNEFCEEYQKALSDRKGRHV
ncbi:MAG: hypothetical protein J5825_05425 [Lachnospiraceae bacterium]|nr:hypothetical protein [Lachnospiraceae bacterium]